MTRNEVIEILKNNYPKTCKMVNGRYQGGFDNVECDFGQALTVAIEGLKEIQQYCEIGTVDELKDLIATICESCEDVDENGISIGFVKNLVQLGKYREIGTVEECREAVEKQIPKKPKDSLKIDPVIDDNGAYIDADTYTYLICPNCGEMVGRDENIDKFCPECGQAILQEDDK